MRKAKHQGKRQHKPHRTPPRGKRPEAVQREFDAKARHDEHEAAEELKRLNAIRKKL